MRAVQPASFGLPSPAGGGPEGWGVDGAPRFCSCSPLAPPIEPGFRSGPTCARIGRRRASRCGRELACPKATPPLRTCEAATSALAQTASTSPPISVANRTASSTATAFVRPPAQARTTATIDSQCGGDIHHRAPSRRPRLTYNVGRCTCSTIRCVPTARTTVVHVSRGNCATSSGLQSCGSRPGSPRHRVTGRGGARSVELPQLRAQRRCRTRQGS